MFILLVFAVVFGFLIGKKHEKKGNSIQKGDELSFELVEESETEHKTENVKNSNLNFINFMTNEPKKHFQRNLFESETKSTEDCDSPRGDIELSMPDLVHSSKSSNLILHYSGSISELSSSGDLELEMQKYSKILEDGKFLNSFDIISKTNFKSSGQIYRGRHKLDGHIYDIKVIEVHIGLKENIKDHRLFKEVLQLSKLKSRYVKRYYSSWIETSPPEDYRSVMFDCLKLDENSVFLTFYLYVQTDFISGLSLDNWNKKENKLDRLEIHKIFRQISKGILSIHIEKLAHRNLKSSNVFINDDLGVKLVDFEFDQYYDYKEQQRADIYQLGIILLELLLPKTSEIIMTRNEISISESLTEKYPQETYLIKWLLSEKRPNIKDIVRSDPIKDWERYLNISPSIFN